MSTKTLRKRIALVAVSAMGFGLLSSVAANATAGDAKIAVAANGANTTSASRGIVSINGSASTTSLSATSSTTSYMSVLSTGWVSITVGTTASQDAAVSVKDGVIGNTTTGVTLNAAQTTASLADTMTVVVKPASGATQSVVTAYTTTGFVTSGAVLTINWVSAATAGVYDSGKSLFSTETSATAASDNVDATWTPSGGTSPSAAATERNDGVQGYFGYYAKDANGSDLSSPVVTAATTGGCLLNTSDSAGNISSAYQTSTSGYFRVDQPTAHVPATCTVTISINGVSASSRTFNFRGQVAKIKIDSVAVVKAKSAATANAVYASAYDSAGNALDAVALAPDTSYYNANLTSVGTVTSAPFGTGSTDGSASITCTGSSANKMKLKTTNASAATIKSDEFTINCAGDPASYAAALDKTSYVPGDIATLTITAKDSKGALTNDAATLGTTASPVSIAGSNLTAVATPSNVDTFTSGVKKYKFIVGSTEGSYQLAIDLPLWDSSTQSAITVPYTIKASSTSVSNAEVLAAIVKLIASINKQIAALQKAIMKK